MAVGKDLNIFVNCSGSMAFLPLKSARPCHFTSFGNPVVQGLSAHRRR